MSRKNLITKTQLAAVKQAENTLADNLFAHVNASLSQAHGILLYNLPHPTFDEHGNDISFYADSNGDRVGFYQARLTYNNVNYFVPLESSTLSGKSALTGVTSADLPGTDTPGATAWTTDFTPEDVADLTVANSSVLLPHTQQPHWEVHTAGIYQILPQIVVDSAGHRVSNFVARIVVDGVELWLPCDSRIGGPVQLPRLLPLAPSFFSFKSSSPNAALANDPFTLAFDGTKPVNIQWEASNNNVLWQTLPTSDGSVFFNLPGWSPGIQYVWTGVGTPAQATITIVYMRPAENTWRQLFLRATASNPAGSVTSNVIEINIYDKTGSWIVYAAHEVSPFTPSEMRQLYHLRLWALRHRPAATKMYMGETGSQLVDRMRAKDFNFASLTETIKAFLAENVDLPQRFNQFQHMVLTAFQEHWPDCPDPVTQSLLADFRKEAEHRSTPVPP